VAAPAEIQEEEESEDWMTTYADAITLLMAFFVMMLTFAKYDMPAYQKAAAAIKGQIGGAEQEATPTELLKIDLTDVVFNMQADQVVDVQTDDKGIVIELASSAFYKPGSATIRAQAIPLLKTMGEMLMAPRYRFYTVEVAGHTDDDPIHTARFPSNWELSAARATRVVRFFIELGMNAKRIEAKAYAATRPKVPNRDAKGNPIRENQAKNRRVILHVYPMDLAEEARVRGGVKVESAEEEEKKTAPATGAKQQPPAQKGAAPQANQGTAPQEQPQPQTPVKEPPPKP